MCWRCWDRAPKEPTPPPNCDCSSFKARNQVFELNTNSNILGNDIIQNAVSLLRSKLWNGSNPRQEKVSAHQTCRWLTSKNNSEKLTWMEFMGTTGTRLGMVTSNTSRVAIQAFSQSVPGKDFNKIELLAICGSLKGDRNMGLRKSECIDWDWPGAYNKRCQPPCLLDSISFLWFGVPQTLLSVFSSSKSLIFGGKQMPLVTSWQEKAEKGE